MAWIAPRTVYLRPYIPRLLSLVGRTCTGSARNHHPKRSFSSSAAQPGPSRNGPLRSSHAFPTALPSELPPVSAPVAAEYDLSCLPLATLLRNLLTSTVSASPVLLGPCLRALSTIAYSSNPLVSPTYNPLLRLVLKRTLYAQFCAGETPAEVRATVAGLKAWGIQGVLLGWAREVECRRECDGAPTADQAESDADAAQIAEWVAGTTQTMQMLEAGDMTSMKFTGAGALNLARLRAAAAPSPTLAAGLTSLCELARAKGVSVVLDAEQIAVQPGIEAWTLDLQRRYNRDAAVVIGTYQAYLRATPARLARELQRAVAEGFVLGVKLVRGAYLGSDPRDAIFPTKEGTDAAYDGLAAALIRSEWGGVLPLPPQPPPPASAYAGNKHPATYDSASSHPADQPPFPRTRLILATHNAASARKGLALQRAVGHAAPPIVHAQLMGMAEHVSCGLVRARREMLAAAAARDNASSLRNGRAYAPLPDQTAPSSDSLQPEEMAPAAAVAATAQSPATEPPGVPRPYKYLVWGSLTECLQYLVRRAEENRDAVGRTEEGRKLLWAELRRRVMGVIQ